tara:strand:+ start:406 stop:774 length:369 start_codon:yes stop_codon:yes gene_type:complete
MEAKIKRIDRKSLEMILDGQVDQPHSVVIKFYGEHCYLCHNLSAFYKELPDLYEDVKFYAFNMADGGEYIETKYGFEGIPSICLAKTSGIDTQVKFLKEPKKPDRETWYYKDDIKKFIETYK